MSTVHADPYRRWRLAMFLVSVPLGVVSAATVLLLIYGFAGTEPSSGTGTTGRSGSGTTSPLTVSAAATSTAPPEYDYSGTPVAYGAANLIDGVPETAWRAPNPVEGLVITLTLSRPARLTSLGLVPGYAKIDPSDGMDRFPQNGRVALVRWSVDDGSTYDQAFYDSRSMQSIPVDEYTRFIYVQILAVRPGSPGFDFTAISEIRLVGS